jgi:hypothetical protein
VTEADWLACDDPTPMLEYLRGKASDRKLRLFAVACSHRAWDRLDDLGRAAVAVAEQYADGLAGPGELRAARLVCRSAGAGAAWYAAASAASVAARNAALSAQAGMFSPEEGAAQAALLRCLVGNPFRPISTDLSRMPDNAVVLARTMYESRDFTAMPLLADLLKEAGCPEEVSEHCRGPGPHVRGCWVVDLLLGKG